MTVTIKIGTSTLTHSTGVLNIRRVEEICKVISDIKNAGHKVVIVSSGAIAMGVGKLGLPSKPDDIPGKQACASVGQCELMYFYDRIFSEYHHTVAQILMTGSDVENEVRYSNFANTLSRLLQWNAIPIINENDTVVTDEIVIGDNDTLAAIVACSIQADKLILLSDIDGLYTDDPRKKPDAEMIHHVTDIEQVRDYAGQKGSVFGTGGMKTKLDAAQICMDHGVEMVLANGSRPKNLYDIIDGKEVGTRFGR